MENNVIGLSNKYLEVTLRGIHFNIEPVFQRKQLQKHSEKEHFEMYRYHFFQFIII